MNATRTASKSKGRGYECILEEEKKGNRKGRLPPWSQKGKKGSRNGDNLMRKHSSEYIFSPSLSSIWSLFRAGTIHTSTRQHFYASTSISIARCILVDNSVPFLFLFLFFVLSSFFPGSPLHYKVEEVFFFSKYSRTTL